METSRISGITQPEAASAHPTEARPAPGTGRALVGLFLLVGTGLLVFVFWDESMRVGFHAGAFLAAAGLAAALLHASACAATFSARLKDLMWLWFAFGVLYLVPLLPFLGIQTRTMRNFYPVTLGGVLITAIFAVASARAPGRHWRAKRNLPELEGELRFVAEETLRRVGLAHTSLRVAPFPHFNAMARGMRGCVVIVDRRACDALSPTEFAALTAHEARHILLGGIFPVLAVVPWCLLGAGFLVRWELGPVFGISFLLGGILFARAFVQQIMEFLCDRFAAHLVGPGAVASLLSKLHADLHRRALNVLDCPWFLPVLSHPPLAARLAALGVRPRDGSSPYAVAWFLAGFWLILAPAGILGALRALDREGAGPLMATARLAPLGFVFLWVAARMALLRARRASDGLSRSAYASHTWWRFLIGLSWVNLGISFASWSSTAASTADKVWFFGSLALFAIFVITGLATGAFRNHPHESGQVIAVINILLSEGRVEEALARVDRELGNTPDGPRLSCLKAACLIRLGRLEEAARSLELPRREVATAATAMEYLAAIGLLEGRITQAMEFASAAAKQAPEDPDPWMLLGLAELMARKPAEAEGSFARASELKGVHAGALAGRAIAKLERGALAAEVEPWLAKAREQEPKEPFLLLAGARFQLACGNSVKAHEELGRASELLKTRGYHGWVPLYERAARQWGLS